MPIDSRTVRFVRALGSNFEGVLAATGNFEVLTQERVVRLGADRVTALVSAGVVGGNGRRCWANSETAGWLKRQLAAGDHGAQHRTIVAGREAPAVNLDESPLARLAAAGRDGSPAFLAPHQVEAGERLRRLVERAQLAARTTMRYDATRTAHGGQAGGAPDIADFALDARRQLGVIAKALPAECAGVLMDVCGLLKGLQQVETERGWPRRSAKLVLRIALEQLAAYFGYEKAASGPSSAAIGGWLEARPTRFE